MKVLTMAQGQWYLLEHEGLLYLDVLCRHSNRFMIQLNEREVAEYRRSGNLFLEQLARNIQYVVPILKGARSSFQGHAPVSRGGISTVNWGNWLPLPNVNGWRPKRLNSDPLRNCLKMRFYKENRASRI
ncbi:hypothetical protein [Shewanella chilikensis]|uniref:hypothetical protein n=1 Tax=Shewanella chilikensis TaxID=558541 RepID=UPI003999D46E